MEYKELARFPEENGTVIFEDVTIGGKLEWLKIIRREGAFATFIEYDSKKRKLESFTVEWDIGYRSNTRILHNISRKKLYENIQLLNETFDVPINMFKDSEVRVKVR